MPQDTTLESNGSRIAELHRQLDTSMLAFDLISRGSLRATGNGTLETEGVRAWIVANDDHCNVFMSVWDAGAVWPDHKHPTSIEYLICVLGKFDVSMQLREGALTCALTTGDCVRVDYGVAHSVKAEEAGRLIAVCVPAEPAYSAENLKKP